MANWYVRSGAGGAGTGADWANAKTTLAAAITAGAAGDTYYISEDHAETQASALTLTMKGTKTAPDRFLCVNHSGSVPPVSADLRTTATITTTGTNALAISIGVGYWYGVIFSGGTGASSVNNSISPGAGLDGEVMFDSCSFRTAVTSSGFYRIGSGTASSHAGIVFNNTTFSFGATGAGILARGGTITWKNTASALLGTIPTTLFIDGNNNPCNVIMDGVDLSACSGVLVAAQTQAGFFSLINCKLHASATITTPVSTGGSRVTLSGSSSAGNVSRNEAYTYRGTQTTEATIVRSSGASDSVTPVSWKLVSTANSKPSFPFISLPVAIWNPTVSGNVTATIEIVNDGVTLTNADIWIEAEYLGSSAQPLASGVSSGLADVLATGANITTSSVTWTTTGLASPTKQKMSVTFAPRMAGLVRLTVRLARASTTVYVDPLITLT